TCWRPSAWGWCSGGDTASSTSNPEPILSERRRAPSVQRRRVGGELSELRPDLGGVVGARRDVEVAPQVVGRGGEALQALVESRQGSQILRRARREHEQEVDRSQRALELATLEVDPQQVAQHPTQDAGRASRLQEAGRDLGELRPAAGIGKVAQTSEQLVVAHRRAAVE